MKTTPAQDLEKKGIIPIGCWRSFCSWPTDTRNYFKHGWSLNELSDVSSMKFFPSENQAFAVSKSNKWIPRCHQTGMYTMRVVQATQKTTPQLTCFSWAYGLPFAGRRPSWFRTLQLQSQGRSNELLEEGSIIRSCEEERSDSILTSDQQYRSVPAPSSNHPDPLASPHLN
jgi:hypothetical protein